MELTRSSLLYWYPKIQSLCLTPRTSWIETPDPWCGYDLLGEGDGTYVSWWQTAIPRIQALGTAIGYPCFMKTDLFSGKHSWKDACYVPSVSAVEAHVRTIVEDSLICDLSGLPTHAMVVREFLPLKLAGFTAFWGALPIAKERRYFVRDGRVETHFPYWPAEALEATTFLPSVEDWRERLYAISSESDDEITELSHMAARLSGVLTGEWSMDFAQHEDGRWFIIDLAEGEKSWRPSKEER